MIHPKDFYEVLNRQNINFYAGVPDSLLKDFCAYVTDHVSTKNHIITANEGSALALAAGYHLSTGNIGLVYMQNSGFGNIVNPLTSLADAEVYAIPMLLVIGWRGEPGKKDEPQHIKMGRVQKALLEALEIPHAVLPDTLQAASAVIDEAMHTMKQTNAPYALLVRAGTFETYKLKNARTSPYEMSREEAIGVLADALGPEAVIVSTTGMPSRELFEHRVRHNQGRDKDFLTVGSMGHSSQIALGIALQKPEQSVYCLDGDGAVIMHMGGLSTIGTLKPKNFRHIVLNNGAHDSVGGQPTSGFDVDFGSIARANGYRAIWCVSTREELLKIVSEFKNTEGPTLLEVRIKTGARSDLGRPTATPRESKEALMKQLP